MRSCLEDFLAVVRSVSPDWLMIVPENAAELFWVRLIQTPEGFRPRVGDTVQLTPTAFTHCNNPQESRLYGTYKPRVLDMDKMASRS